MTPNELRRDAERGEMIPQAPVRAGVEILIDASVDTVWSIMTDVAHWPSWHPYLKNAELGGAFTAGTSLRYGGLFKHRLMVARAEPCVMAVVYGRLLIYDGITRWDFAEAGSRIKVKFTESSTGLFLRALYSEAALRRHLQEWLDALKVEAERCQADAS